MVVCYGQLTTFSKALRVRSEATEKEVLFSDERIGKHLSGNKEAPGWYVLYKLIVGGHIFDRKPEAVSRDKCCV